MVSGLINPNPVVYQKKECRDRSTRNVADEFAVEHIDQLEIFDAAEVVAAYFASDVNKATIACFFELHVIIPNPRVEAFAENLILSSNGAPQSQYIKDPEHPYSLEELKVITEDAIEVNDQNSYVRVTFTPTVEHCSMATVIGLCLRVKLMRSLPSRYKIDIRVAPGTHATEAAVNKQLNDKERVAAALENPNLLDMVDECLAPSYS